MKGFFLILIGTVSLLGDTSKAMNIRLNSRAAVINTAQAGSGTNLVSLSWGIRAGASVKSNIMQLQPRMFTYPVLLLNDARTNQSYMIELALPFPSDDLDESGLPDFLEVTPGFSGDTEGIYLDPTTQEPLPLTAHWEKPASTNVGFVTLRGLGAGTFVHRFEFTEYRGTWTHSRTGNFAFGPFSLQDVLYPTNHLVGSFSLSISFEDFVRGSFNVVGSNGGENSWGSLEDYFGVAATNRTLKLYGGELYGAFTAFWQIHLESYDDDGNGRPDLTDFAPVLNLTTAGDVFSMLVLKGPTPGCVIERSSSIISPQWETAFTIAPGNGPQVSWEFSRPQTNYFWRARIQ